jgi:glutamate-ammonia-ligase adenylyltransferase
MDKKTKDVADWASRQWMRIPEALRGRLEFQWERFAEAARETGLRVPGHPDFKAVLYRVWTGSEFVAESCTNHPEVLVGLLDSGDLLSDYGRGELEERLRRSLAGARDPDHLASLLRQWRQREMVRIAWRDLAGWAPLEEVLRDLSDLADACVGGALERLHAWQSKALGPPRRLDGSAQSLIVLGMGKLGAHELNFSSDIDLIFAFPEHGQTRARGGVSHEEYFARLGQQLIQVINDATHEGFVFRVDMRLRPYGNSGPLAMSFDALEDYYQTQGREWERYAMIKARPIAGDPAQAAELMELLRPFVYRRYLDYGAFESLRDLKVQIAREIERKGLQDNIKLGPGGIREVEFIAQAFQLVRGGREPALRQRRLLEVLPELARQQLLPEFIAHRLGEAYRFLRRVENRLQAVRDEQTHRLPRDEDERARLAFTMGYGGWGDFLKDLERHRRLVDEHFRQVFAAPQADGTEAEGTSGEAELDQLWRQDPGGERAAEVLKRYGYDEPEETARWLTQLRSGTASRFVGEQGRARYQRLIPMLLHAAADTPHPSETFARLARLVEQIAGRTTYLTLLVENPMALSQLVRLCGASPWIAEQMTRHPLLMDELLDPRTLYSPMEREILEQELAAQFQDVAETDLERQMEALRQFQQAAVLRVAAADVAGVTPLMVVSDYLTEIAEVVLRKVLQLAWDHMVSRYGQPRYQVGRKTRDAGICILAYGKLGGFELGYGSDLDLVFLCDGEGDEQFTTGEKRIPNQVFFARLGQRMIHMLDTLTPSGVLYEVDMRLRPSGASGQLVPNVHAFEEYQHEDAWTWEHQALVRARPVAGDPAIAERFQAIRRAVLSRPRDADRLRGEVRDMRERMRQELGSRKPGRFDLKQDRGGIADIEFMVQYELLLWSHDHPDLLEYTDNIRLLDGLERHGLLPSADTECLREAYKVYRARGHQLTLQEQPAAVGEEAFPEERGCVCRIWQRLMEPEQT